MELAAHWHRCQNLPKKRVNTSLLYRERDDPVKERLANWRTRSGTLGSVEERYTGTLHGRTSKILATWQIDSYPRQADAYLCLKRAIYRRFLKEMALICSQLFSGEVMSSFLIWTKLCAGKSAISLSIYVQNAGDFIRRRRQGYALSDTHVYVSLISTPLFRSSAFSKYRQAFLCLLAVISLRISWV